MGRYTVKGAIYCHSFEPGMTMVGTRFNGPVFIEVIKLDTITFFEGK